jgi:serine/threonine protein kinase
MTAVPPVAALPIMLPSNSVAVASGPPFAVGAHGQVQHCAEPAPFQMPEFTALISQLHRGYLNGLKVAVKQLRSGTCDTEIAEQLLLEEAALMQVKVAASRASPFFDSCAEAQPLRHPARVRMHARIRAAAANGDGALRRGIVIRAHSQAHCHHLNPIFFSPSILTKFIAASHNFAYRQSAPLPLDFVLSVMKSVCSAVTFAHDNSVIHRDIKPGNVLLTSTGAVKLCDFGLSRRLPDAAAPMTQGIGTPQATQLPRALASDPHLSCLRSTWRPSFFRARRPTTARLQSHPM